MGDDATQHLARYAERGDFDVTPEPRPATTSGHGGDPHFVIQHHLATADHYDFRLEIDGVLVSWAVPKGPSTDPGVRRMAKRTEDHPLAYETFEGAIGRGQYGGGTVQVWDIGSYRNISTHDGEPTAAGNALRLGHLAVDLAGQKLTGGYTLIRTRGRGEDYWLLIKRRGAGADARRRPTSTQNRSALTGRTLAEIARDARAGGA